MVLQLGLGIVVGALGFAIIATLLMALVIWFRENPAWVPPPPFKAPDILWLHEDDEVTERSCKSGKVAIQYKRTGIVHRPEVKK